MHIKSLATTRSIGLKANRQILRYNLSTYSDADVRATPLMIKKLLQKVFKPKSTAASTSTPTSPAKAKKKGQHQAKRISAKIHRIDRDLLSVGAVKTTEGLQKAGFEAFVVGGAVRDLLLQRKPKDFDIATNATPEEVNRVFRRSRIIGRRFRLVHVMFGDETIETRKAQ